MKTLKALMAVFFVAFFCAAGSAYVHGSESAAIKTGESRPNAFWNKADDFSKPLPLHGDQVTLKMGAEARYRFEYRDDFNLSDVTYEDDGFSLLRNRLSADFKIQPEANGALLRVYTEGQAAQSFASSGLNKTNLFVNQIDLRQLFVEWNGLLSQKTLTLKAGRQELSYGDERFIGPLNWTNTARVFDAVKAVYTPWAWLQTDFFFAQVVRNETRRPDKTMHDDNLYGLYSAYKKIKDHTVDTFLFIRNNRDESLLSEKSGDRGALTSFTTGNRFKGRHQAWDYGTEYALQFGRRAHDSINAWSFHQEAGYTFSAAYQPRLYAEFNHASGDRNPSDGKIQSFDHLFPTNHNKYGLIDFLGFRNMNDVMLGTSAKPTAKWAVAADFHWFFLDAKESTWFNATGGVFRGANPQASRQLGEELDLTSTYAFNTHLSGLIGYSHFFSGPFAKDTGAHDDANFFYVQMVFKI